jgi:hypothetical protein
MAGNRLAVVPQADAATQHEPCQQPPCPPDAQRSRLQQQFAGRIMMSQQVQVIGDTSGSTAVTVPA